MPRTLIDYAQSILGPLSSEQRFQAAAKNAGFGVQSTPDGGQMITKPSPDTGTLADALAAKKKAKIVPQIRPMTAATRG